MNAASAGTRRLASLQRVIDLADVSSGPRVLLTHGAPRAVESLAVLDSSFNPPTVAHIHLLEAVAGRFGLKHRLALLSSYHYNAIKLTLAVQAFAAGEDERR